MNALRLALKLAVPALVYVLVATAAIVVFIWSGAELWEALIVVCGGLLVFAWYADRKSRTKTGARSSE